MFHLNINLYIILRTRFLVFVTSECMEFPVECFISTDGLFFVGNVFSEMGISRFWRRITVWRQETVTIGTHQTGRKIESNTRRLVLVLMLTCKNNKDSVHRRNVSSSIGPLRHDSMKIPFYLFKRPPFRTALLNTFGDLYPCIPRSTVYQSALRVQRFAALLEVAKFWWWTETALSKRLFSVLLFSK